MIIVLSADFVCYRDDGCAENDTRPVFALGSSAGDCCGRPDIQSAWQIATDTCTNCGMTILTLETSVSEHYNVLCFQVHLL